MNKSVAIWDPISDGIVEDKHCFSRVTCIELDRRDLALMECRLPPSCSSGPLLIAVEQLNSTFMQNLVERGLRAKDIFAGYALDETRHLELLNHAIQNMPFCSSDLSLSLDPLYVGWSDSNRL